MDTLEEISGALVLEEGKPLALKERPYWRWGGRRSWGRTLRRKDK